MGRELVAAEVQSSDDYRLWFEDFGNPSIRLILLLFVWKRATVEKKVFGAEKADSFCAVFQDFGGFIWLFDVGGECDAETVDSDSREVTDFVECFFDRESLLGQLAVLEEGLIGWVDDQQSVETVQQGILARFQSEACVLEACDSGQFK